MSTQRKCVLAFCPRPVHGAGWWGLYFCGNHIGELGASGEGRRAHEEQGDQPLALLRAKADTAVADFVRRREAEERWRSKP